MTCVILNLTPKIIHHPESEKLLFLLFFFKYDTIEVEGEMVNNICHCMVLH